MHRTEPCKFGHLEEIRIGQSAKAVETAGCKRAQAKETLGVGARVRVLQCEEQAKVFWEEVVGLRFLAASVKQSVAATSLVTAILDLASKVSRSGSVA